VEQELPENEKEPVPYEKISKTDIHVIC